VEESLVEVPKILGDVFEAVVCAMYLDSGMDLELVWKIVRPMFMPFIGKTAVATQFFILSFTSVAQSSEQAPFTSEFVGLILMRTHVKKVSQRSAESHGFSPGAPVSSHRES
jgi:dsRNA-specific ribonuclease